MNPTVSIEERLTAAYAVEPRGGFDAVDARLAATMAGAVEPHPRLVRRRLWKVLLLAAALLVLAGATISALRLLDGLATATPGISVAWDRGIDIGERQVSGGYAVTVVRGYADANSVLVGVSVEPLEGVRNTPPLLDPVLRDPAGVVLGQHFVSSVGSGGSQGNAEMLLFAPPTASDGKYTLELTLGINDTALGPPLIYRFSLPDAGGAMVNVGESQQTEAGVLTLDTVRLSPTAIDASLHLEPSDMAASDWAPIAHFNHDGQSIDVTEETYDAATMPRMALATVRGVDDPGGSWTLVVTELVGDDPDGSQVRLQGPWTFSFEVP